VTERLPEPLPSRAPVIPPSRHKLAAMASFELQQRRRELEACRRGISDTAPIQIELAGLLAELDAEAEDRRELARAGRTGRFPHVG
jgi:hypothetical protein